MLYKKIKRYLSFIKINLKKKKINKILSEILPKNLCVDAGASYYEHSKWVIFLNSINTTYISFDPNSKNLEYTKHWHWKSKIIKFGLPLWSTKTLRPFYLTNGESGSSLLKPFINKNIAVRYKYNNEKYLFPYKKKNVATTTLDILLKKFAEPIFLKIDTQGSELEILKGAIKLLKSKKILGLEIESSLLHSPMYLGSSKFWEIVKFLENLGYELIDLKKIDVASYFKYKINSNKIPNECDATFVLNQKNIYSLDIEKKILILSFFISYNLIEEAIIFIENNNELKKFFDKKKYGYSKFLQLLKNN